MSTRGAGIWRHGWHGSANMSRLRRRSRLGGDQQRVLTAGPSYRHELKAQRRSRGGATRRKRCVNLLLFARVCVVVTLALFR